MMINKKIQLIFSTFFVFMMLILPNKAFAIETDTTGPIITIISCDKENETLYEGDSIKLTFNVEDPSGIGSNVGMLMTYVDPNGEGYREFLGPACIFNETTGLYECVFTVNSTDKVGTYKFAKLHAYDQKNNEAYINPNVKFYIDTNVHKFGEWIVIREATCIENGIESRCCSYCDKIETREINATGHLYVKKITEPTCTESGYTTCTCECGDTYIANIVSATGHNDSDNDGYCETCDELICSHNCHKTGFEGFFWKIANFFNKLFGSNKYCDCGATHY